MCSSQLRAESRKVAHSDLNMAGLRAVVRLLERLQLQRTDNGEDGVHSVSREFSRLSTAVLASVESPPPDVRLLTYLPKFATLMSIRPSN